MRWRIYIETTIPSFYYNDREEVENVVRCRWTRRWWDQHRHEADLYTSPVVTAELRQGTHHFKKERLTLLDDVPVLRKNADVESLAGIYVNRFLMPSKSYADAYHMAFASVYHCDTLLTWNCAHLANPNKRKHLLSINGELAFPVPLVVTPLELLGENAYE